MEIISVLSSKVHLINMCCHICKCTPRYFYLGYGIESDFKMILRTLPAIEESLKKVKRIVNLEGLAKKVCLNILISLYLIHFT